MNRILIVDDEEAIHMLYAEELADEGYEVFAPNDYSGIMDVIKQQEPDLIVFEIRSGKVSDLYLLRDVLDIYCNMPVILCSAYPAFTYNMVYGIADFYVVKSANLRELKCKIEMAISSRVQEEKEKLYNKRYLSLQITQKNIPFILNCKE